MPEFKVRVEDPGPVVRSLRELADLIDAGKYQVNGGGICVREQGRYVMVDSNLILEEIPQALGPPPPRNEWYAKSMELVCRHNLGYLHNPGGGQFTNREVGINIQIFAMDDEDDYKALLKGLQKLGLEPAEEKKNDSPT